MEKEFFRGLAVVSLLFLASCATTTLTGVWKDPNYQGGPLKKVLVVGVAKSETNRRMFEDQFSAQLRLHGIDAIPSYPIDSEGKLDKNTIIPAIQGQGIDAVFITRLINKEKRSTYYPPQVGYVGPAGYYGDWYPFYDSAYDYVISPGYVEENEVLTMETALYDTQSGKLIWSALSETFEEDDKEAMLKSFMDVIMKNLQDERIIQ